MKFWETTPLHEMSADQWESLCDGCAKCCLHKLEDEDTEEVVYTSVACKLLDINTCRCDDYPGRKEKVPECLVLSPEGVESFSWLPKTCAYRLVYEGKPLFKWHPLISGKKMSTLKKGKSVAAFAINELETDTEDLQDYVIRWVDL